MKSSAYIPDNNTVRPQENKNLLSPIKIMCGAFLFLFCTSVKSTNIYSLCVLINLPVEGHSGSAGGEDSRAHGARTKRDQPSPFLCRKKEVRSSIRKGGGRREERKEMEERRDISAKPQ